MTRLLFVDGLSGLINSRVSDAMEQTMIELGYMAKLIENCPQWLGVSHVRDIYSVANCVSHDFCDYIGSWEHNGFGFFNSPSEIRSVAAEQKIELADAALVYYRGYDRQFDAAEGGWRSYAGEKPGSVMPPSAAQLLGHDIVTYSMQNAPECSPLSCNGLAKEVPVNEYCLIDSLDDAIDQLERGVFNHSEPGPFRIIAVHAVEWKETP